MSARRELFRRVAGAFVDEERANSLLDAYRAEILHEAADTIRNHDWPLCCACPGDADPDDAADLIDPKVGKACRAEVLREATELVVAYTGNPVDANAQMLRRKAEVPNAL